MEKATQLTAIVLTLNEEDRIERCLKSLDFVASVVVMDSFSTDGTLSKAKQTWLKMKRDPMELVLVVSPWKGFLQTRNESLHWVKTKWVLWVDSDEWLSEELKEELVKKTSEPDSERSQNGVFKIARQSCFLGRAIRHGGWYPDRKARLAQTLNCQWVAGPNGSDVHEDLVAQGSVKKVTFLKGPLFHEPFRDQKEQEETNESYSTLLAEGLAARWLAKKKSPPSNFFISLKVVIKFIENYFWKLGCLDGKPGFLIALGSSRSLRMRLQKARALTIKSQRLL